MRAITAQIMRETLLEHADEKKSTVLQRFFKTDKGEYGEGDNFAGITVPKIREIAKKFINAPLYEIAILLSDPVHECRLMALLNLCEQFKKADEQKQTEIFNLYIGHTQYINNWDLVDLSAYQIVGNYLKSRDKSLLYRFAASDSIWEQRISIISTWIYIRNCEFGDTLRLAAILMNSSHDLIQKAVGWMLREIGKKDKQTLIFFLDQHYRTLPRTTLRYAIEKLTSEERAYYLKR